MKFITRELYQGMQLGPGATDGDDLAARWQRACDAYRVHLDNVRSKLPPRMQTFADTTLHDGVVCAVERPGPSELVLEVDATANPWGPDGIFRLRFTGVRQVEGIDDLVGDCWLYEEVHLHPDAGFDYRVLFWRSDFRMVADDVDIEPITEDHEVD